MHRSTSAPLVLLVSGLLATAGLAAASPAGPSGLHPTAPPRVVAPYAEDQIVPEVTRLADGHFVVVFEEGANPGGVIGVPIPDDGRDGDLGTIVAALLDADGASAGEPFVVNQRTALAQRAPSVAADPTTGGFHVAWLDADGRAALRRFAVDGTPTSDEIVVGPPNPFSPDEVQVVIDHAGTSWVVWEPVDSGSAIQLAQVSASGAVSDPVDVTLEPSGLLRRPRAVALERGVFVGWTDESGSRGQVFRSDGTSAGLDTPLDNQPLIDLAPIDPDRPSEGLLALFGPTASRPYLRPVALGSGTSEAILLEPGTALDLATPFAGCTIALSLTTDGRYRFDVIDDGALADGVLELDAAPPSAFRGTPHLDGHGDRLVLVESSSDNQVESTPLALDSLVLSLGADGRFEARITWRDFEGGEGVGLAVPLADDTGAFWFFDPANLEVTVKVLDGRAINGHFWVFQGSLTNVEYTLTVTDTVTDAVYTVHNPLGQFGSFGDVEALPGS